MGRLVAGRLVPYWSRAEIEAGQIGDTARPLLWLADPVDLFFLQIQGAGRVRLPDDTFVRVGYDGKNGRPYTPIGRILVHMNALAPGAVTMQSIRGWLAAHRDQAKSVMDQNEDYVFFRVLMDAEPNLGPPGALGVKLVPGRSAAVDRRSIPLGTPIFVDTTEPGSGAPWRHLLLAQDVGSDILGAARADVFLGAGAGAEAMAGAMHQGGTVYVLLPKQ
jgi:membrane-bound lytic murein transglycosylase A